MGCASSYVFDLTNTVFTPSADLRSFTSHIPATLSTNHYLISFDLITDAAGNRLDGEWTNPFSVTTVNDDVSEFPSGDGSAGGAFNFVFTILPGDANLTNIVDSADLTIWYMNWGLPGVFTTGDFDGGGDVDSSDFIIWQQNLGVNLQTMWVADFNRDFVVDGADYTIWSMNFGQAGTHQDGDVNLDGYVDGQDWSIWQQQQGLQLKWVM